MPSNIKHPLCDKLDNRLTPIPGDRMGFMSAETTVSLDAEPDTGCNSCFPTQPFPPLISDWFLTLEKSREVHAAAIPVEYLAN